MTQSTIGKTIKIIAKIEKREALICLEEIVRAADGIMVARGDLGVETDVAETPMVQKRIVALCRNLAKPVIVASAPRIMSVSKGPGATAFTRTFCSPHSQAMVRVMLSRAAFDAP